MKRLDVILRSSGLAALLLLSFLPAGLAGNPPAPRQPVTNEYHGVQVVDDFQWLEKAADPRVREWTEAQNRRTAEYLSQIPERRLVEGRLQQLFSGVSANYYGLHWRTNGVFALKFKPPAPQPVLVWLASLKDLKTERVVFNPAADDPSGRTAIDFFQPSPDGGTIAVSLSQNGSEQGTLHFFETATGRKLPDKIQRVQQPTAGGSVAWDANGSGVFYTRYPRPGERPEEDLAFYQQVYFHRLGAPEEQDSYELGKEFPRIAEVSLHSSPDGGWLLATVANGDGGEYAHYLRAPTSQWRQITKFTDGIKAVRFGQDTPLLGLAPAEALYLLSTQKAPRGKILRLGLAEELAQAVTVVKEGPWPIRDFAAASGGFYLHYLDGGPSALRFHDFFSGKQMSVPLRVNLPEMPASASPASVHQMLVTRGDELLFRSVTYTEPFAWLVYDPNKGRADATALRGSSPVDFSDAEAVRVMVKSRDGTPVPLNIIRKKGTRLNGENPVILTGYGGYGLSLTPDFDVVRRLWLDQDGVIAIANLRGGGEFGEAWHRAGNLTNKQNVFDDFAACARWLVNSNYTRPSKLAIQGGSNGGLLMGAMLTQHPELVGAVVSHVGIYDMLRVELDPNGAFNTTEFGSVKDLAQFRALQAYSPYHHVRDDAAYPPVLFLTGEHDGRVNPAHSRKMTARLQAAASERAPVLLRVSGTSGHGQGTALPERLATLADVYAFLLKQLGVEFSAIDRGPWAGAVTTNSVWVKAKLVLPGLSARLLVSQSPSLTDPVFSEPMRSETNHYNLVDLRLEGLAPDTQYYYALEIDGRVDRARRGEFRTFPEGPASFSFAYASCAKTGSTSDIFDCIRGNRPLFFMNVGDFHYLDISASNRAKFNAAYDTVLASPPQARLYRAIPFVYLWDDHDFGGNNCNKKTASRLVARQAYQDWVPHYPLAFGHGDVPVAQTFTVGRVKFILTDMRSDRELGSRKGDTNRTILGPQQKEWFKQELLSAKGRYPLICWVGSVPWLGALNTNYYPIKSGQHGFIHHTNLLDVMRTNQAKGGSENDHWNNFAAERREIADFIKDNHIAGVCYLHGDSHMLAADDGRHADYATGGGAPIPVMCAGPLEQAPSIKGGPYSQGVYRVRPPEGGFGLVTIHDRGDVIGVSFSGRNNKNEEKIALKFTVAGKEN